MSTVVVRCTACRQPSRVAAEAVGWEVACPRCPATFVARPDGDGDAAAEPPLVHRADPGRVPVVRARPNRPQPDRPRPIVWDEPAPVVPDVERAPATGGLLALSLIPFGIPLLWLLASVVTQREVVFSFAVPVAVAVGAAGLAFGIVNVDRWSLRTRVKSVLGLTVLAYAVAALLFVVSKEWLQDLRRVFNRGDFNWKEFRATATDTHIGFIVQFPSKTFEGAESPVPEWDWKAYRHRDGATPGADTYTVAVGPVPARVAKAWDADRVWLDAVGKVVGEAAKGYAITAEPKDVTLGRFKGREFVFAGDGRDRVVRVYRAEGQAVYLAVEGAFVPPDGVNVRFFFNSFRDPMPLREPPPAGKPVK